MTYCFISTSFHLIIYNDRKNTTTGKKIYELKISKIAKKKEKTQSYPEKGHTSQKQLNFFQQHGVGQPD